MNIHERAAGDLEQLRAAARGARDAEQKDRLLGVAHALAGWETLRIAEALGRSRAFVQRWAYAYRDGGIGALKDKPQGGSTAKISGSALVRFKARIDAGPTDKDKVCTLRGKDLQRIAREELNANVSLTSVYRTLHRLGYSCLAPRPRHEKQDLEAQRRFKEHRAPFL